MQTGEAGRTLSHSRGCVPPHSIQTVAGPREVWRWSQKEPKLLRWSTSRPVLEEPGLGSGPGPQRSRLRLEHQGAGLHILQVRLVSNFVFFTSMKWPNQVTSNQTTHHAHLETAWHVKTVTSSSELRHSSVYIFCKPHHVHTVHICHIQSD